jgi:hypothetical protein
MKSRIGTPRHRSWQRRRSPFFGYLRRDPDIGGFLFWLSQVNSGPLRDGAKQHAMVCSFITSVEYQQRFSSVVTHSNVECEP